jgi:hypothetical protein
MSKGKRPADPTGRKGQKVSVRLKKAPPAAKKARWEAMIAEATVDCYNEDEAFAGMLATLEDRLEFPFEARALGEKVEVIELDERASSERSGVVAKVRKGGRQHTVALADVTAVEKDSVTAEWLAAYRYWLGR